MSTHHNDHAHHGPTNFWTKYVFSTDHKVIGIQFTFASLFFVIIGAALAIGVRYQIAWPNQHVPFKALLPGNMTNEAPEANIALWPIGGDLTLTQDVQVGDQMVPAGASARLRGFPQGLAITVPAGTVVEDARGTTRTLAQPVDGLIPFNRTMGDYDYTAVPPLARVPLNSVVQVPGADGGAGQSLKLVGSEVLRPGAAEPRPEVVANQILLPIRAMDTVVALRVPAQDVKDADGQVIASVEAVDIPGDAGVTAMQVAYYKDALTTDAYLQLFTMHATVMIFFVLMPMLMGGFGNFLIPLMIGARDMAFPKLNMLSFWIAAPSAVIMLTSFWTIGGPAGGGWTMYPTLSSPEYSRNLGTTLWLLSVGLVGFSTIVGTLNYITTIINMRAPGMTMFRLPLTIWSLFITSVLALFATPVLTAGCFALMSDRVLGTMFFDPSQGGQPLLWQHLFWFFGHPEVYILILPAMGIVSDVMAANARKPVFGYKPMVFAMIALSGLGFVVWGHHMFQSGMNPILGTTFMASTIMIAVPSAIKTFNWLGTLWGGNIKFTPAMLNALGFVSMFVIGGLSGIFMASAPIDIIIHDTYFIVAHIHYVLFGGTLFAVFAGVYHWYPKMFGRQMNAKWGVVHFILTIISFNGTFFLMHILGVAGHPRRYASILEYPTLAHLQPMNVFMTICAIAMGTAQIPFFYNFFASLPRKLARNVTAFFAVTFGLPMAMGLTFYSRYSAEAENFAPSLAMAFLAGAIFIVVTVAIVYAIWEVGRLLHMPAILQRLLYIVVLPAFLAPALLKKDLYMWINMPELYDYRWVWMVMVALPGLAYLVIRRPQDQFGFDPGDNPWQANSLEWTIPSPPPFHNFDEIPTVYRGAYEYSSPVVEKDYLPQQQPLPAGVVEPSGH